MAGLLRLLKGRLFLPNDPITPFTSKTIVITGGTSGLGLEAAVKYLSLGATTIVLGVRNRAKAAVAAATISTRAAPHNGIIKIFDLDMESSASVKAFATRVEKEIGRVDVALLNAGVYMRNHELSKEGWEKTLQVNTLSTALLALLLLPHLKRCKEETGEPAHLTITSSGLHSAAKEEWFEIPKSGTVLEKLSDEENFNRDKQYPSSKLLVEYMVQELATLATTENGEVEVVVNSVCPGACKSDLGRQFDGFWEKIMVWIFMAVFTRSTEAGSRSLVSATATGVGAQGRCWKDDKFPEWVILEAFPSFCLADPVINSTGPLRRNKEVRERMWTEIVEVLNARVPEVQQIVSRR